MGLRAINNPKSSFEDPYLSTGKEAAGAPPKGNEVYATGGTKTIHPAGYTTHVFDYPNSDSFVVSSAPPSFEIDYLVIGGGGHGGGPGYGNGGGGAGGNITQTHFPVPVSCTIPITVGQGGQSAPAGGNDSALNCPWLPAPAQAKTAYGGGKGGGWLYPNPVPNAGGSAGGGGAGGPPTYGSPNLGGWGNIYPLPSTILPASNTHQGTPGGWGALHGGPTGYAGGGGGGGAGAGAPARPLDSSPPYSPGRGIRSSISGTATHYSIGGDGGEYSAGALPAPNNNTNTIGAGGNGGGGGSAGRAGMNGQVIIRYASLQALGGDTYITATGGDSTIDVGDYRTHLFTSPGSGTFQVTALATNPGYNTATVCIIAGGGSAGSTPGGGGGGGGVAIDRHFQLSTITYPVSVGTGGPGPIPSGPGEKGIESTFTDPSGPSVYTAYRGGAGSGSAGTWGGGPGASGGGASGGGGPNGGVGGVGVNYGFSAAPPTVPAETISTQGGFTVYGSPGGVSRSPTYGGGGGGAGGVGCEGPMAYHAFEPSPTKGGMGGNGIYIPEFSDPTFPAGPTWPGIYAGGGGGSGPGGSGPPNRSAYGAVGDGAPFRANTGDGGYAGSPHGGAPGIVMIRYKFQ